MMMGMHSILAALYLFNLGIAKDLKYFSNFKPGPIIIGPESVVTDFVTMTSDSVSNLPNAFTICSSQFIEVMTSLQSIIQIMKEDGTQWFSISYSQRESNREEFYLCIQSG